MFVLVRHGQAVPKRSWPRRDAARPLSERGRQQALGLVPTLSALDAPRLLAGPALRCRQTLEPLAEHHRRRIEIVDLLTATARTGPVEELVLGGDLGPSAVLCLHNELLVRLLRRWRRHGPVRFTDELSTDPGADGRSTEKGGAWVVTDSGDGPAAHYLRPVHVGPVLAPASSRAKVNSRGT